MTEAVVAVFDEDREYFFEEGCYIIESWNKEEDPACSIARARVPPGVRTATHSLEGITERYLIIEGEAEVYLGDAPAQRLGPGDVVIIPAGCRQAIRNTADSDLLFYAICTPRFRKEAYETAS